MLASYLLEISKINVCVIRLNSITQKSKRCTCFKALDVAEILPEMLRLSKVPIKPSHCCLTNSESTIVRSWKPHGSNVKALSFLRGSRKMPSVVVVRYFRNNMRRNVGSLYPTKHKYLPKKISNSGNLNLVNETPKDRGCVSVSKVKSEMRKLAFKIKKEQSLQKAKEILKMDNYEQAVQKTNSSSSPAPKFDNIVENIEKRESKFLKELKQRISKKKHKKKELQMIPPIPAGVKLTASSNKVAKSLGIPFTHLLFTETKKKEKQSEESDFSLPSPYFFIQQALNKEFLRGTFSDPSSIEIKKKKKEQDKPQELKPEPAIPSHAPSPRLLLGGGKENVDSDEFFRQVACTIKKSTKSAQNIANDYIGTLIKESVKSQPERPNSEYPCPILNKLNNLFMAKEVTSSNSFMWPDEVALTPIAQSGNLSKKNLQQKMPVGYDDYLRKSDSNIRRKRLTIQVSKEVEHKDDNDRQDLSFIKPVCLMGSTYQDKESPKQQKKLNKDLQKVNILPPAKKDINKLKCNSTGQASNSTVQGMAGSNRNSFSNVTAEKQPCIISQKVKVQDNNPILVLDKPLSSISPVQRKEMHSGSLNSGVRKERDSENELELQVHSSSNLKSTPHHSLNQSSGNYVVTQEDLPSGKRVLHLHSKRVIQVTSPVVESNSSVKNESGDDERNYRMQEDTSQQRLMRIIKANDSDKNYGIPKTSTEFPEDMDVKLINENVSNHLLLGKQSQKIMRSEDSVQNFTHAELEKKYGHNEYESYPENTQANNHERAVRIKNPLKSNILEEQTKESITDILSNKSTKMLSNTHKTPENYFASDSLKSNISETDKNMDTQVLNKPPHSDQYKLLYPRERVQGQLEPYFPSHTSNEIHQNTDQGPTIQQSSISSKTSNFDEKKLMALPSTYKKDKMSQSQSPLANEIDLDVKVHKKLSDTKNEIRENINSSDIALQDHHLKSKSKEIPDGYRDESISSVIDKEIYRSGYSEGNRNLSGVNTPPTLPNTLPSEVRELLKNNVKWNRDVSIETEVWQNINSQDFDHTLAKESKHSFEEFKKLVNNKLKLNENAYMKKNNFTNVSESPIVSESPFLPIINENPKDKPFSMNNAARSTIEDKSYHEDSAESKNPGKNLRNSYYHLGKAKSCLETFLENVELEPGFFNQSQESLPTKRNHEHQSTPKFDYHFQKKDQKTQYPQQEAVNPITLPSDQVFKEIRSDIETKVKHSISKAHLQSNFEKNILKGTELIQKSKTAKQINAEMTEPYQEWDSSFINKVVPKLHQKKGDWYDHFKNRGVLSTALDNMEPKNIDYPYQSVPLSSDPLQDSPVSNVSSFYANQPSRSSYGTYKSSEPHYYAGPQPQSHHEDQNLTPRNNSMQADNYASAYYRNPDAVGAIDSIPPNLLNDSNLNSVEYPKYAYPENYEQFSNRSYNESNKLYRGFDSVTPPANLSNLHENNQGVTESGNEFPGQQFNYNTPVNHINHNNTINQQRNNRNFYGVNSSMGNGNMGANYSNNSLKNDYEAPANTTSSYIHNVPINTTHTDYPPDLSLPASNLISDSRNSYFQNPHVNSSNRNNKHMAPHTYARAEGQNYNKDHYEKANISAENSKTYFHENTFHKNDMLREHHENNQGVTESGNELPGQHFNYNNKPVNHINHDNTINQQRNNRNFYGVNSNMGNGNMDVNYSNNSLKKYYEAPANTTSSYIQNVPINTTHTDYRQDLSLPASNLISDSRNSYFQNSYANSSNKNNKNMVPHTSARTERQNYDQEHYEKANISTENSKTNFHENKLPKNDMLREHQPQTLSSNAAHINGQISPDYEYTNLTNGDWNYTSGKGKMLNDHEKNIVNQSDHLNKYTTSEPLTNNRESFVTGPPPDFYYNLDENRKKGFSWLNIKNNVSSCIHKIVNWKNTKSYHYGDNNFSHNDLNLYPDGSNEKHPVLAKIPFIKESKFEKFTKPIIERINKNVDSYYARSVFVDNPMKAISTAAFSRKLNAKPGSGVDRDDSTTSMKLSKLSSSFQEGMPFLKSKKLNYSHSKEFISSNVDTANGEMHKKLDSEENNTNQLNNNGNNKILEKNNTNSQEATKEKMSKISLKYPKRKLPDSLYSNEDMKPEEVSYLNSYIKNIPKMMSSIKPKPKNKLRAITENKFKGTDKNLVKASERDITMKYNILKDTKLNIEKPKLVEGKPKNASISLNENSFRPITKTKNTSDSRDGSITIKNDSNMKRNISSQLAKDIPQEQSNSNEKLQKVSNNVENKQVLKAAKNSAQSLKKSLSNVISKSSKTVTTKIKKANPVKNAFKERKPNDEESVDNHSIVKSSSDKSRDKSLPRVLTKISSERKDNPFKAFSDLYSH